MGDGVKELGATLTAGEVVRGEILRVGDDVEELGATLTAGEAVLGEILTVVEGTALG